MDEPTPRSPQLFAGAYAPPPRVALSEDEIKRAFLPFLKQFYKYRYEFRPETLTSELDNVSTEGWVADGLLRFQKDDGAIFTCTYEATSLDKAEEVKFSQNQPYFLWDCAAFGAFATAVLYGILYFSRFKWLVNLQWNGNAGMLLGLFAIGFFCWYFLMRRWKKYRYIYAIAQFKRYFADEQWVALGADVFPAPTDPYLTELKDQCIYNGFGLALVAADGSVRPLVTPSRLGIFGKDRKMTHWVTRTAFYQAMSKNIGTLAANRPKAPDALRVLRNQLWRPVERLVVEPVRKSIGRPAGQTASAFNRFMDAHTVQKWMFSLAVFATALLLYRVLTFREESRFGKIDDYKSRELTGNPEDQAYSLDPRDAPVPYVSIDRSGIPKQYPDPPGTYPARDEKPPASATRSRAKAPVEEEVSTIDLSSDDEGDTPTLTISNEEPEEEKPAAAPKPRPAQPAPAAPDPCARLRQGWFVQDNVFSSRSFADQRIAALKKAGISSAVAPRSCVEKGQSGWLVWLGAPQSKETVARQKAADYEKTLQKAGLLRGPLLVRKLN